MGCSASRSDGLEHEEALQHVIQMMRELKVKQIANMCGALPEGRPFIMNSCRYFKNHWDILVGLSLLSPSGDLGIGLVWDNRTGPDRTGPDHISVWLLKSSSKWTKSSMRGPQLFSGWYQMILGVFRCSQLFSDVFRLFSNCFPTMFSDCWNPLQAELNYLWWVLSCSQDDIRWF